MVGLNPLEALPVFLERRLSRISVAQDFLQQQLPDRHKHGFSSSPTLVL